MLRALALGARAVSIVRPLFWGLAVDGEAGVRPGHGVLGVTKVADISRGLVALPREAARSASRSQLNSGSKRREQRGLLPGS